MLAVPKHEVAHRRPGRHSARSANAAHGRRPGRWTLLSLIALTTTLCAQMSDVEVPYSSVFRESGNWTTDPLRDMDWSTDPQLKIGDGALQVGGAGFGVGTNLTSPLRLSAAPQDAMFRLWRLYLDIPQSYAEVIASDNANQTRHDREEGIIGIIATDFRAYLQVTERLQLTASGRYVYLPFEGTGGFQGSGLFGDGFNARADIDANPSLFLGAQFDGTIGRWDVFISDRIGIRTDNDSSLYSRTEAEARLGYLESNDFDKVDQLGIYSLGGEYSDDDETVEGNTDTDSDSDSRWEFDTDAKYNQLTVGFMRQLPTDTVASVTFFRRDSWGGDTEDNAEASDWQHGVNLSLRNQHFNMRFKPYLSYTATEESDDRDWEHVARLGVSGPLTEYTDLNANVGYRWHDGSAERDLLWYVSLHNELNELTSHRLSYSRRVEEPQDEIHTTLSYSLHRTLGPRMEGMLFARWTEEDESDGQGDGHDETEYSLGAGVTWEASSRLTLRLTAGLTAVQEEDTEDDHEEFNVKLAANYDLTDTMSLWASYEYTREDEGTPNEGYVENLFRMRLTKQW